jgi:PAS domain S-box-containing protein
MFQWSLGGFVSSGAVMLWAMFALVGTFTFQRMELNVRWLLTYLGLTVFSGVIDSNVAVYAIQDSKSLTTFFFVINIFAVSAVVFGLSIYLHTKQHQVNQELKILSIAVEQATDSVVITNTKGVIEYVNHAFEVTTGYSKGDALGQKPSIIKSGEHDVGFYKNMWQIIMTGTVFRGETTNKRKNGTLYTEQKVIIPLKNERQQITHFLSMGRDITEQRQAEQEKLRLVAIEQQLNLAQEMQRSLLPFPHPNWSEVDVICFNAPADDVGGDFYQYARHNNKFIMAVGDVSGKGISAALLMAISLSQFDASLLLDLSPRERMAHLDRTILPYTQPKKQNCAMCYVELEIILSKHQIHIVNAGGIPPYIKRANGKVEFYEMGGFALGQGLGMITGYQVHTIELLSGDMVILTSDGVIEANNPQGQMLGFDTFAQMVQHGTATTPTEMLDYLKKKLFTFIDNAKQHDDMTIIVVQV